MIIKITLSGEETIAEPDPVSVNRGDTVIWSFEDLAAERDLRVVFLSPSSETGPFPALDETTPHKVIGKVPDDAPAARFEYKIFEGPKRLSWANGQESAGLEVPPRSGGTN